MPQYYINITIDLNGDEVARNFTMHAKSYRGTTEGNGPDPSSIEISKVTNERGEDVTNAFEVLFGLDNIVHELEL